MAETVHLFLESNGTDIKGDSTQTSQGREDSIECFTFDDGVRTAREKGSGVATGRRSYEPMVFTKRLDRSTPLLAKALCNNEELQGTFRFYRPNPSGDGTTEHFFSVEFKGGRVAHIKRHSPDALDPASSTAPPMEEVGIVFHTVVWTYEDGGVMHSDNWSEAS